MTSGWKSRVTPSSVLTGLHPSPAKMSTRSPADAMKASMGDLETSGQIDERDAATREICDEKDSLLRYGAWLWSARHARLSLSRSHRVVTHEQLSPERCPRTQLASICHSGSLRLSHRRGPLWV